jgi:hypothetical protein
MYGILFRACTLETLSKDNNMKASNNAITTKPHSHVSVMFLFESEVIEIEAHVFFSSRMPHCG